MKKWNELSMAERVPYLKMGVDSGIYDASIIADSYNKFEEGGIKEDKGYDWIKPKYWFTPSYEASSLKEAITKAYDDGINGSNILYNGRAYKAILNDQDVAEYKGRRFQRVIDNKSKTSRESGAFEDAIANIHKKQVYTADSLGHPSNDYFIPYIYDKEISIPGVGRTTTNMLDSIYVNAKRAGIPLDEALGLAAEETLLGASPTVSLDAKKKAYRKKHNKPMPKEEQRQYERRLYNMSYARNFGGIYPQFLINNHEWYKRGWETSKAKDLKDVASPLEHGYRLYKKGLYNTGDPYHSKKAKARGRQMLNTKVVKDWLSGTHKER